MNCHDLVQGQLSRSVRQQLQCGSEKGEVQSTSAEVVEAELVSRDLGLTGGLRVVPFKCERTCFVGRIENLRAKIARIEKWIQCVDGRSHCELLLLEGLDRLSGFPVIHDVLEMKSEYFSMNAAIVQNA